MMQEGIRIFSETGSPQASDSIFPLGISKADNLTLVNDGFTHPQPMVVGSIQVTGVNPVVAFLPPVGVYINEERVSNSGSSFTFYFRAKSNVAINMAYWVFDVPSYALKDPTLSTAGLKSYNSSGVLNFDAATSNFRIVGYIAPEISNSTTPGEGQLYQSTGNITVPPGKTYALVQSEYLYASTMWNAGQYAENPGGMIEDFEGTPGLIPPNAQHKTMELETYYSAGGRSSSNVLTAGMIQFELFKGWYAIGEQEHIDIYGNPGHTVIDVSNFIGGGTVNPGVISVNVDNLERSATGPGGSTTLSNYVNLSISGGVAPYTITWQKVPGGAAEVVNDSALNATSFRTKVVSQAANTVYTAKWRANVVDANGLTGSGPDVTFTHSATLVDDYITDPITPFTAFNVSSPEHDVSWDGSLRQITGINKPITLRFERYNYTGNLSGLYLDIFTAPAPSGPWTHHGYFNAHEAGTKYLDVAGVVNGTWIAYNAHAVTTSGRREGNCNITVWNLTAPGGSVKISDVNNNNFIVDSNDDYNNADYTPNALNWSNIIGSTNDSGLVSGHANQTVTGINRPTKLKATLSNVSATNAISASRLEFWVNGAKVHDTSGFGNGYWTEATFNNGDYGGFVAHIAAGSVGVGTISYTVTVTNESLPNKPVVDTFTVSQTVYANYVPPDYTLNPISIPSLTLNTNEPSGYTNDRQFQVLGINQPVILQFTRGNQADSGGIFTRRLFIYHSTNGGASYTEYFIGAGPQGVANITVNNGDYILLRGYFDTTGGRGQSSYTGYITNQSTGGNQIASYSVSGTVDANDDYDRVRITFDNIELNTTDPSGNTNASFRQISGLTRPHSLRFTRQDINNMFMQGNITAGRGIIAHSTVGSGGPWTYYTLGAGVGASVTITVNNGDWLYVQGYVETSSGSARAAWYSYISDLTTGESLGSWYTNGLVDKDNNFNVVALSVNVGNPYSSQNDYVQSGQWYGISGSPSVTVTGGTPPYSYNWVRTYHNGSPITISSTTIANPTFSTYAQTSWRVYAEYTLTVTDSAGGSQVVGFTADWAAGDQEV